MVPLFTVTVIDGVSDKTEAEAGETIIINANAAHEGEIFDKWITEDNVTFANENEANTTFVMPEQNVTVTATYKPIEYSITILDDGNGTATANVYSAIAGTEITLTTKANEQWEFDEWEVIEGNVTIEDNTFTMPMNNVTVKAHFKFINSVPNIAQPQALTAWSQNGMLYISGLVPGEAWSVYTITGTLVYRKDAVSPEENYILPNSGIYIVNSGNRAVKVIIK